VVFDCEIRETIISEFKVSGQLLAHWPSNDILNGRDVRFLFPKPADCKIAASAKGETTGGTDALAKNGKFSPYYSRLFKRRLGLVKASSLALEALALSLYQ